MDSYVEPKVIYRIKKLYDQYHKQNTAPTCCNFITLKMINMPNNQNHLGQLWYTFDTGVAGRGQDGMAGHCPGSRSSSSLIITATRIRIIFNIHYELSIVLNTSRKFFHLTLTFLVWAPKKQTLRYGFMCK